MVKKKKNVYSENQYQNNTDYKHRVHMEAARYIENIKLKIYLTLKQNRNI